MALKYKKIKREDTVVVISGKDKGKKGRVLRVDREKGRVLVEGVNKAKRHMKKYSEELPGGIIEVEMPLNISNVMVFCSECNRGVRVGFRIEEDGKKTRICKSCGSAL